MAVGAGQVRLGPRETVQGTSYFIAVITGGGGHPFFKPEWGRPFEMRGTNVTRRRDSLHDIIKCAKKPVSRRLSIKASGVGAGRKKREGEREKESVDDLVKLSSSL